MGGKGFVFVSTAFLLIVPVLILMASLIEMESTGRGTSLTVTSSDSVYYTYNNILNEIAESSAYGDINETLDAIVNNYTSVTGLNITYIDYGNGTIHLTVKDEVTGAAYISDIPAGKVLLVNIGLSDVYPVYPERGDYVNITVTVSDTLNTPIDESNIDLNVYYPNSTLAINYYLTTDANGMATVTFHTDTTALGKYNIDATANKTGYIDGFMSTYIYVWGLLYPSISTDKTSYSRWNNVNITSNLIDELGNQISGANVTAYIYNSTDSLISAQYLIEIDASGEYYNDSFSTGTADTYTVNITAKKENYFDGTNGTSFNVTM